MKSSIPGILVLDTCVLLSNVLRRMILGLSEPGGYLPVWSERIGGEWRRNAARIWGVSSDDIDEQWRALQVAFPLADQGDVGRYEDGLHRSDPKDWHVIAAGRAARKRHPLRAAAIVTRNLKDFNRTDLRGYGISLLEPDELLLRLHAQYPQAMQSVLPRVIEWASGPGRAPDSLEAVLKRERLFRFNRLCRSAQ